MGRPIQSDVFGDVAAPGLQFAITAKIPGEAVAEGYIVEQQGTAKYRVNINGTEGVVFLVNTLTPANLNDGEAFVAVTPFGGSTVAASKIMQRRVYVFNIVDSPFTNRSSYKWSDLPAAVTGEADVGVSVAVVASNTPSATDYIFAQTPTAVPPNPNQAYITTLRTSYTGDEPPAEKHRSFATSDNKVVIFHQNAFTNGVVDGGYVTVIDGTTAGQPTVIGGSEITSTWEFASIDESRPKILQLTDTRYVRQTNLDTSGPTNSDRLELIDVNLTTGAATIDITHDLEQYYDANNLAQASGQRLLFKISSTRFGMLFTNSGVSTSTTAQGGLYCMIFDDAGTSVTVQMSKTLVIDMTAPANNEGDITADVSRLGGGYLGNTNRIVTAAFETSRNAINDGVVISFALNSSFNGIDTIGTLTDWIDNTVNGSPFFPRIDAVDNNHFLLTDEDRTTGLDAPYMAFMGEVNTGTLATTLSSKLYVGDGAVPGDVRIDRDYSIVIDGTKAYMCCSYEDAQREVTAGTLTINQSPFDGNQDIDNTDRLVDTAANLATAWPGQFSNTTVLAVDTGLIHYWDGGAWQVATTNIKRWDYRGLALIELDINVGTNTVTNSKQEMVMSNTFSRLESDGAGGVQNTYAHSAFDTTSNNLIKLPNGNWVMSYISEADIREDSPYYNLTDYNARSGLYYGGSWVVQYFDPANMP
jgi:hypothetical protein